MTPPTLHGIYNASELVGLTTLIQPREEMGRGGEMEQLGRWEENRHCCNCTSGYGQVASSTAAACSWLATFAFRPVLPSSVPGKTHFGGRGRGWVHTRHPDLPSSCPTNLSCTRAGSKGLPGPNLCFSVASPAMLQVSGTWSLLSVLSPKLRLILVFGEWCEKK